MNLENYIKNKNALCYIFPEKKKENEANDQEVKQINSVQDIKNLIADIDKKLIKEKSFGSRLLLI